MSTATALATFPDPAGTRVDVSFGSGTALSFDTTEGEGRAGPSPTESLLGALAACTALDVAAILRKKRQEVRTYHIAVEGTKSREHPKVYTHIVVEHRVAGRVDPEALRRSIELSATSYCPVSAMLSAGVRIEHRYRLWPDRPDGTPADVSGEGLAALVVAAGPDRG
ncbi:MAG TPA: OsmC family protein [candidate division Zixibacteria bacterium]|nr:OsmC family protein [candidate division Zixibacteria bacterium]